jgi:oligopeptide transport system substrate-binding protein
VRPFPVNQRAGARRPGDRVPSSTAFLLLALLFFVLPACSRTDRVENATKDKILLLGNGAEPKALDPHLISAVGDSNIARALFEGLVTYHPSDDAKHEPGVAKSWEPNEDFTEWIFHLRDDAKWSNGDPVTAHDFVYAYNRILHPEMGSPYASMLYILKNAKEYNMEEIDEFSQVGVKALDDHTLKLSLNAMIPYLPDVVKHATWYPVHQGTIEKFGTMTDQFTLWQRPGNHVGNGPFKLEDWRINAFVEVSKNPEYWDADNVKLNGIIFYPIDNTYSEERAFRDGLLHYTYVLPDSLIPSYRDGKSPFLQSDPYLGTYFFRCNVTRAPLDNKYLRRALAFAIDREKLVEYVTQGGQVPAYGFTCPVEGGYDPPHEISFDPEKARAYLKKAGYENGKDVPPFSVIINTSESHKAIAVAIQDMWKTHLGLENVSINNQEWKVFQQTLKDLNFDVARSGWIGDFIDPTTFLDLMRSDDTNNETGWRNEEYDRLIQEAKNTPDLNLRDQKLHQAEEILLDFMPIIPIYWYARVFLLHPDVKNWNPLLLDNHSYKHIDLVPSE